MGATVAKLSSDVCSSIFRIFYYIFMFCFQFLRGRRGIANLLSTGYITAWKILGLCEMLPGSPWSIQHLMCVLEGILGFPHC